jgi:nucleotide-binding universal stress UspA family protein
MIRVEKILCPVDFFPASERAVDYAIALAKNYRAKVILLHVVGPILPASYELSVNTGEIIQALRNTARSKLNTLAQRAAQKGVTAEFLIRIGDVDLEICDVAREKRADLIIMGKHGRRTFEHWFLGSVTERLMRLRRMSVPLITIGAKANARATAPSLKKILVTTDFSDGTPDAMRYAFSLGRECKSDVTLLHVLNDVDASISGRYRDQLIKSIRLGLEEMIPAEARGKCKVDVRVETGRPLRTILDLLESEKFDLIVMNVHGKDMLEWAMIGRTAEGVIRGATTPVLLVPATKREKARNRRSKKAA